MHEALNRSAALRGDICDGYWIRLERNTFAGTPSRDLGLHGLER
jgi:hypothetical protein